MTTTFAQISMSLDGYVAGPDDGPENPLGDNGEWLHEWVTALAGWRRAHGLEGGETGADSDLVETYIARAGATILGRRMFDFGERYWGDTPPFRTPVFVLTSRAQSSIPKDGGTTYHFVTNGVDAALEQAREAAGQKDISIAGGANVIQQFIAAGLLDELHLHIVPVMLGGGVRLFDRLPAFRDGLEQTGVIEARGVVHLTFRLAPARVTA